MSKFFRLIGCIALVSCISYTSEAQNGSIDTIVVLLNKDTFVNKMDDKPLNNDSQPEINTSLSDNLENKKEDIIPNDGDTEIKVITPTLDLSLLKKEQDSIKQEKEKMLTDIENRKKDAEELKKIEKENAKKLAIEKARLEKEEALARQKAERELNEQKKKDRELARQETLKQKELEREQEKIKKDLAKKQAEQDKIAEADKKEKEKNLLKDDKETDVVPVKKKEELAHKDTSSPPIPPVGIEQKDNNYGTIRLAYDELATSFLLTIPTETKMHYHNEHSEHILLIEGKGMILMGYKTLELHKNELVFITKGTPHKIINTGPGKLKVLSIQSPFYDGTDQIILE